jgi:hypothetical protein
MPTDAGRPFIGSEDFMDLFTPSARWDAASSHIGVFKLYGEWVAYHATDAELRAAISEIRRREMVLAVEMGPLDPPPGCGQAVESFAGTDEGRLISRRIREAGGTLQVIALDEPYYFGHLYDGPNACGWSVRRVAEGVARFRDVMRDEWPAVVIGDIEPTPFPVGSEGMAEWLDTYRDVAGEPLAFLHLDIDWSRPDWPALGVAIEHAVGERDVPTGIIYNGGAATSDGQWLAVAGRRVQAYESDAGAHPDHVIFQSWMDKPDFVLPESSVATFTWMVRTYVEHPAALVQPEGEVENLAFEKQVTASAAVAGAPAGNAVDGDTDSPWISGAGPPAWIEIDLGQTMMVAGVRLSVAQDPPGRTHHRVTCRAARGGDVTLLGDLRGRTAELDVLVAAPEAPASCRFVRIDTLVSPSWVAWREIEVEGG